MAKIYNQSGALKDLLGKLNNEGISRFSDIKSILNYKKNWQSDVDNKFNSFRDDFIKYNEKLKSKIFQDKNSYEKNIEVRQKQYQDELKRLSKKIKECEEYTGRWVLSIIRNIQLYFGRRKLLYLNNNSEKFIYSPFSKLKSNIDSKENELNNNREHYDDILNDKKDDFVRRAQRILDCFDKYKNELSGAIGEDKAIKQLEKLTDDYIVINDFNLKFNRPIINSKDHDKIFSIQADHLVIGPAGVYLIETKNWSKDSVKNLDLFSPVKQMQRTNYAIFVILNKAITDGDLQLSRHHWGDKKINVKNILLMIGAKTSQEFQFVKILSITQLNQYICYFDKCFSKSDVFDIYAYLLDFKENKNRNYYENDEYDDDLSF